MPSERHSSISENQSVSLYSGEECKYYYLPLFRETLFEKIEQIGLGANNPFDRSLGEIRESILKAELGRYSHVKIPVDRIHDPIIEAAAELVSQSRLKLILQIPTRFLFDDPFFEYLKTQADRDISIEWIIGAEDSVVTQRMIQLDALFSQTHLSVVVHHEIHWKQRLAPELLKHFGTVHLYFCYQLAPDDPYLTCKEAHSVLSRLKKMFPNVLFLPPKGSDLWDHRARHDFDMEPYVLPCYETSSQSPDVRFSVIIPTYNNQNHLRVVIKHLYEQNVGLDAFEVIIVDDGGTDDTQLLVLKMLEDFEYKMNFKYIFFPRGRERKMGDSQYRAGIARNLGVKNSEGEFLCFLDSDIVVPKDYLRQVEVGLESSDAIQAKRINLSQTASHLGCRYEDVVESRDCIPDEPYWEEFIQMKDWHEVPYNWKYVCTHSFSLRKNLFWKVGGLKKNYIFYGFEDTDLGYRLVKNGHKLHLLDVRVYHMFHENTRSEFMNMKSLRHNLLSRTAQIFYLHHLDEDIFENLLGFMETEPTLNRLVNRLIGVVSLRFLWKPRPSVYKSLARDGAGADGH